MAAGAEKLEMVSSQQRVEPAAVAAGAAAHVDVDVDGVVVAVAAAAVAGVGVGAARGAARILPVRTRGQRHHVQIHSHLVLCAHYILHDRGVHHKNHDVGENRKVHALDPDCDPNPVLA